MKKIITLLFICLTLCLNAQKNYSSSDRKDLGIGMTVGGIALTGALFLEDTHTYGTYTPNPNNNNTYSQTYVTPPIYKQFPKNVFIVAGVTITIIGLFNLK